MIRIAIDFDNVLADTTGVWIKYYNRMYNKSLNKSEIQEYYFWDRLGISEEEAFKLFSIVWSNWKDLPLLETYSPTIVNELGKTSQVDIVTSAISSVGNSEGNIEGWLRQNNFKFSKIVYTLEKGKLDYDIFIDDSPYVAVEIARNNKICLLYDQPWNRMLKSRNITRVKNLFEVESFITKFEH